MSLPDSPRFLRHKLRPYQWISIAYLAMGCLWIVGSDKLAGAIAQDDLMLQHIQTAKGWFFVIVSSILIYGLTKKAFKNLEDADAAKEEIFRSTVRASDHIILNYLNQMQLVMIEAEQCSDFDPAIYQIAEQISSQTVDELKRLEEVNARCPGDIESFIKLRLRETREAFSRGA